MPDPFEALRAPVTPVDPDPAFATRLRAQVERALTIPRGADVTDLVLEQDVPAVAPQIRGGHELHVREVEQ